MSEEDRNNFKTYIVKEKDFTDLIIKDKEDNYYYSAMYVNELQQEIERLEEINKEIYEGFMAKQEELKEYAEENERLNNIINEVREYIEENTGSYYTNIEETNEEFELTCDPKELLEILDKGE